MSSNIFLSAYIIYIPVFICLIFLAKKKYKNYSCRSFWISNLGEKGSPSRRIFIASFIILTFLNLIFSRYLYYLIPDIVSSKIAISFFYLANFAILFAVFMPLNKRLALHGQLSAILTISILFFLLFLILSIYDSNVFPKYIFYLNLIILLIHCVLAYSVNRLRLKYGIDNMINLIEIRKTEKSLILRNAAFLEWMICFSLLVFLSLLSLIIILNF